jgi:hypothetical protein
MTCGPGYYVSVQPRPTTEEFLGDCVGLPAETLRFKDLRFLRASLRQRQGAGTRDVVGAVCKEMPEAVERAEMNISDDACFGGFILQADRKQSRAAVDSRSEDELKASRHHHQRPPASARSRNRKR